MERKRSGEDRKGGREVWSFPRRKSGEERGGERKRKRRGGEIERWGGKSKTKGGKEGGMARREEDNIGNSGKGREERGREGVVRRGGDWVVRREEEN